MSGPWADRYQGGSRWMTAREIRQWALITWLGMTDRERQALSELAPVLAVDEAGRVAA